MQDKEFKFRTMKTLPVPLVVLVGLCAMSTGLVMDVDLTHLHAQVQPEFLSVTIDSGILNPPKWRTFSFRYIIHWRIQGGAAGTCPPPPPPPQQDPFLLFSHTFSPKSVRIGGQHPPNGSAPPMGNPGSATVIRSF